MTSLGIAPAVLEHAQRQADEFRARTGVDVDAHELLTGRAALLGLSSAGRISAGGASHLMAAADGWCAVTLTRPDDIAAVSALVSRDDIGADAWPAVHAWAASQPVAAVVDRARLLGMPAAALGETTSAPPWMRPRGGATEAREPAGLLVADLSSMWAGPLCGQLLAQAGATVVKVESPQRPDGTRSGVAAFFDWMNSGKLSYAVDFDNTSAVGGLLAAADVVIEGSRPAALAQRGLGPADIAVRPGAVWLRITGHGADGERADWVAFGDDAAVAGGLVGHESDGPVFCGDAIADPLAGLSAAVAVLDALQAGGGRIVELSMAAVAATYAALAGAGALSLVPVASPPPARRASALGADNSVVNHLVAERLSAAC